MALGIQGKTESDATVAQLGRGGGLRNRSVQVRILPVALALMASWHHGIKASTRETDGAVAVCLRLGGDSSTGRAFGLQPEDDGFNSISLHCDRGVTQTQEVVILPMRVELPSVTCFRS